MGYLNQAHRIQQYANGITDTSRVPEVLEYLYRVSAANTEINMSNATFLKAPGKKRKVQYNYWGLLCDVEGTCGVGLCSDGEKVEPKELVYDITQCTATKKFKIALDDLRMLDNSDWDPTVLANLIVTKAMPAARKLLATDMLTYLLTKVGVHTDGNTTKSIKLLNPLTGAIRPSGMLDITREYDDATLGSPGTPYILGGGKEIYDLLKLKGSAGMNIDGVDTGNDFIPNLWYDERMLGALLNDLANGDHVLAIDPRIIKIVSYNENAGIFRTGLDSIGDMYKLFSGSAGHDFLFGTYTDPQTGIIWDLYLNFEKCTKDWDFHLEHRWDIHTFPVECGVQGYNGITRWRTCPEVEPACPTGLSPVSPVATQTFSATPVLADVPTISQSTIGGESNIQENPVIIADIDALIAYMNANYTGATFSKNVSNIEYTGHTAITATFNNSDYTLTFS